jgi:hypothetical protein
MGDIGPGVMGVVGVINALSGPDTSSSPIFRNPANRSSLVTATNEVRTRDNGRGGGADDEGGGALLFAASNMASSPLTPPGGMVDEVVVVVVVVL